MAGDSAGEVSELEFERSLVLGLSSWAQSWHAELINSGVCGYVMPDWPRVLHEAVERSVVEVCAWWEK